MQQFLALHHLEPSSRARITHLRQPEKLDELVARSAPGDTLHKLDNINLVYSGELLHCIDEQLASGQFVQL